MMGRIIIIAAVYFTGYGDGFAQRCQVLSDIISEGLKEAHFITKVIIDDDTVVNDFPINVLRRLIATEHGLDNYQDPAIDSILLNGCDIGFTFNDTEVLKYLPSYDDLTTDRLVEFEDRPNYKKLLKDHWTKLTIMNKFEGNYDSLAYYHIKTGMYMLDKAIDTPFWDDYDYGLLIYAMQRQGVILLEGDNRQWYVANEEAFLTAFAPE